jgi:hypothetical protein
LIAILELSSGENIGEQDANETGRGRYFLQVLQGCAQLLHCPAVNIRSNCIYVPLKCNARLSDEDHQFVAVGGDIAKNVPSSRSWAGEYLRV